MRIKYVILWFLIGSVMLVLGLPPVGQTICRLPKKVKGKNWNKLYRIGGIELVLRISFGFYLKN
jgi:hypothetical protein